MPTSLEEPVTDAAQGALPLPASLPGALPLLDAAQAGAGDEAAVAGGATWHGLMERAGGHLARGVIAAAGGRGSGLEVLLLVGKGNNGGDGWVAARRLTREYGARCTVVAVEGIDTPASDEAAANRAAWLAAGGRTVAGTDHLDVLLSRTEVAVDCLLGTGARGAPRGAAGEAAAALVRAHAHGTTVVACDIPSGVAADDGSVAAGAVMADITVTFGALKRGLLLHPGAAHAGRVLLGRLGEAYDRFAEATSRWSALTPAGAAPPPLLPEAEKRARGVVLAVAGAAGTAGAAALTGAGALRAGAGLVTVATPDPVRGEVAARLDPGVMVRGLPSDEHGGVHADAVHALPALEAMDVVVAGPGLGHGSGAGEVVASLRHRARRLVLDADALNVHRDDPRTLADHDGELVLTPHERELARIGGGEDGPAAWACRVERVPELAHELQATIVAKGPGTLVAAPDGRVWVCPIAGPSLGSGGTGDVLAGVVAAAIAHADDVPLAVAQAVWWHAAAGVLAGTSRADRATATDLLAALPTVLAELAARPPSATSPAPSATSSPFATSSSARLAATRRAARWGALPWEVRP
ncbi:MAG: NAD(P)H-hydrate dehydratase [Nitriliruptoraceae bacterium]